MNFMTNPRLNERADYNQIVKLIEPDSRVLDVGCGSGELLKQLIKEKISGFPHPTGALGSKS